MSSPWAVLCTVVAAVGIVAGARPSIEQVKMSLLKAGIPRRPDPVENRFVFVRVLADEHNKVDLVRPATRRDGVQNLALKSVKLEKLRTTYRLKQFTQEVHLMRTLDNPFVLKALEAFHDDTNAYILMEAATYGDLTRVISDLQFRRRLEAGTADDIVKFYIAGVILGLEYLHGKHIAHRDIKPDNILIRSNGYPVIADLGFAHQFNDPEDRVKEDWVLGTGGFAAPELEKMEEHGVGVDWWSLGMVLYELYTLDYFSGTSVDFSVTTRTTLKAHVPPYPTALMYALLNPDPNVRLGMSPVETAAAEIKAFPWFAGFDWQALDSCSMPARFRPGDETTMTYTVVEEIEPYPAGHRFSKACKIQVVKDIEGDDGHIVPEGVQKIMPSTMRAYANNEEAVRKAMVSHPFIVRYLAQTEERSGMISMFLEWCRGGSLLTDIIGNYGYRRLLTRDSSGILMKIVRFYAASLVLSVGHLHEYGIMHCDLKPGHVLLDDRGFIRVTDFSRAVVGVRFSHDPPKLKGRREWKYTSPEMFSAVPEGRYGPECDWWAVGCILYEMLTLNQYDRLANPISGPTIISDRNADDLVRKLLNPDRSKRLGVYRGGVLSPLDEIMAHPFFDCFDWDALRLMNMTPEPFDFYAGEGSRKPRALSFTDERIAEKRERRSNSKLSSSLPDGFPIALHFKHLKEADA